MTLRKSQKPQKPRPVVKRAEKPTKLHAKKLTLPLAKQRPLVTIKARKAARPGQKPAHPQDITPSANVLPSPTARPVITPKGPLISDNTLAVQSIEAPSAPMIQRRAMVVQPPTGVATAEEVQSIGLETPFPKAKEASASEIQASALKASGRPAKPLMVKPVAAGPTIAELLRAKQHNVDTASKADAAEETEKADKIEVTQKPKKPEKAEKAEKDSSLSKKVSAPAMADIVKPTKTTAAEPPKASPEPTETVAGEKVIQPPSAESRPQPTAAASKSDDVSDSVSVAADSATAGTKQELDLSDGKVEATPISKPKAELYGGRPVIIVHEPHPVRDFMAGLLVFIFGLALILVCVNFLLDAGLIETSYNIPHTNLLGP